ncbi:MAG: hypothetical protein WA814_07520 [Candidatus Baltobacteraceae bacterium]
MAIPAPLLLLLVVALSVAFACGGQIYVHRRFPQEDFARHNEVGGIIIAIAGTVYAVVLGFLTVAAWEHFTEARQLVALEAAAAADAWHMAVGLPPARRSRVRQNVLAYATLMVQREWPMMRNGEYDSLGDLLIMNAISASGAFNPSNLGESNAQTMTLQQLGILHDERQRRLAVSASEIGPFEWLILLIGALLVTCFCWLFGTPSRRVHLLMTSCVAVMVASMLVLLFELQYPFRTSLRIGPGDWQAVIQHIGVMQTGAQMDMRM